MEQETRSQRDSDLALVTKRATGLRGILKDWWPLLLNG